MFTKFEKILIEMMVVSLFGTLVVGYLVDCIAYYEGLESRYSSCLMGLYIFIISCRYLYRFIKLFIELENEEEI